MHNPSQVFAYDNESTIKYEPSRSSDASVARIKRRYKSINFAKCVSEMCDYLKSRGAHDDMFDKHRVAERALYPNFGAVGLKEYNLEVACFFWMLANDSQPVTKGHKRSTNYIWGLFFSNAGVESDGIDQIQEDLVPVETKLENFVHALYECQREKNILPVAGVLPVKFIDDKSTTDKICCVSGVINKFCEVFFKFDKDIDVIKDLPVLIFDLVRGFIAEYCHSTKGLSLESLTHVALDLCPLVSTAARDDIKAKVIKCLGGRYEDASGKGLVGKRQEECLDYVLSDVGLTDFILIESVAGNTQEKLQALIYQATEYMRKAEASQATFLEYAGIIERLDFELLQTIILEKLPAPSNKIYKDWESAALVF